MWSLARRPLRRASFRSFGLQLQPQSAAPAQLPGPLIAQVNPLLQFSGITVGQLLLQQGFAPLHQPGQGHLLLIGQQIHPADVLLGWQIRCAGWLPGVQFFETVQFTDGGIALS